MKNKSLIIPIAGFLIVLWLPLISTPFLYEKEHEALKWAEKRKPSGEGSLQDYDGDLGVWIKEKQSWYSDSFGFRSKLMEAYNIINYSIGHYPGDYYGNNGCKIGRHTVDWRLNKPTKKQWATRSQTLRDIRKLCDELGTDCVYIIIPTKRSAHPELAPKWIRDRPLDETRIRMTDIIRENNFPVVDLTPILQEHSAKVGRVMYHKHDSHWNLEGALLGYDVILEEARKHMPEARLLEPADYEVTTVVSDVFSRANYLGSICTEPVSRISNIHLPPVTVTMNGVSKQTSLQRIGRRMYAEIQCDQLPDKKVLIVRDSYVSPISYLINHSFGNTIYAGFDGKGFRIKKLLKEEKPDLLIFALNEISLAKHLDQKEKRSNSWAKGKSHKKRKKD